jgi:glycosyltransferase involved in cell wall biosynthesis
MFDIVGSYSFMPLLATFEKDTPGAGLYRQRKIRSATPEVALLIPCHKSELIIGQTLEAAVKTFPVSNIYVIANGNSTDPLDNTENICRAYGVHHIWCPVGSKIVALFVGCYVAKRFRYVLLIDDDCILPEKFPLVTSRLTGQTRCIGYTIKSVSADYSKGSYWQQSQDLEYKLSGLQRIFAGKAGSATFPHGAISLWDRQFLKKTLHHHPGYSISEDWFLGNSCRRLGGRIQMCSTLFVPTSTPSHFFLVGQQQRGGFGETTIVKQRFSRWNFFLVNGIWYNLLYILGSWKLGKWELGTKLFVLQEVRHSIFMLSLKRQTHQPGQVYQLVLCMLGPYTLPISLLIQPKFCLGILIMSTGLRLLNIIIFNEYHLRTKNERIDWRTILLFVSFISPFHKMPLLIMTT